MICRRALIFLLGAGLVFPALAELPDFSSLVEEASQSVVNVSTRQHAPQAERGASVVPPNIPRESPWFEFFEEFFGKREMPEPRVDPRSLGSGFVISRDGYIITNYHVIKNADEIIIRLNDRRELPAELIGTDVETDTALLKVEAEDLPVADLGSSEELKPGQWVVAIGSPFGFEYSVTAGIVSAMGRSLPSENYVPFIQTDVAVNPGNSGGPLFNLDGEVVGINSQIYSHTGGFMGVSFAVPIEVAINVVDQLREKGEVVRGWLGVYIQEITRELSESFGLEKPQGALVSSVIEDGPAEDGGIRVGDVILEFDDREIRSAGSLPPIVGRSEVGEEVDVRLLRDGEPITVAVTVGRLPEKMKEGGGERIEKTVLGLSLADLEPAERERLGIEKGAVRVTGVTPGPARSAGIVEGDLLLSVDNQRLNSVKEVRELIPELQRDQFVTVLIMREDRSRFLAMRIPEEP